MRVFTQNDPFFEPALDETLFSLSNGYLGVRASRSESPEEIAIRGTYINGFYDRVPMIHAEKAFGFPDKTDKLVRIIDTQTIRVLLDGEAVELTPESVENYRHELRMEEGISLRAFDYMKGEKRAHIRYERMASLKEPGLFVYSLDVDYEGEIEAESLVQAEVYNFSDSDDPRVGQHEERLLMTKRLEVIQEKIFYEGYTASTKASLQACITHHSDAPLTFQVEEEVARARARGRGTLHLEKRLHLSDSYHYEDPAGELLRLQDVSSNSSYAELKAEQAQILQNFWQESAVTIEGDVEEQRALHYLQYQLFQNAPRGPWGNIAAKGLSGEGYEGHYFWDSEIYLLPVFEWLRPELATPMLAYRYQILEEARKRSLVMGQKRGACYAWRTISGIECSGYFPAGSAQYHLSADIAHAMMAHYEMHDDVDMLADFGAEVIFETARLWLEVGHFDEEGFHIFNVTGPDEYTAIVDDNYYTNLLARKNLRSARTVYDVLQRRNPQALQRVTEKIGLTEDELGEFQKAAAQMVLLYDDRLGIHAQDSSFLHKPAWDLEANRHLQPLLLNVHPLSIYRHQVLKQADTILAYTMEEAEEDIMRRGFDYYEARTTHDSSLSKCVYGIMASRLGDLDKAYEYFRDSLYMDLHNTHGNTKDGLHMANVAGSVLSILTGFAGLRSQGGRLALRPRRPKELQGYRFPFRYRGRRLQLEVGEGYRLELLSGSPIEVLIEGEEYLLTDVLEGGTL